MPQYVHVPELEGDVEFPDELDDDQIAMAISREFYPDNFKAQARDQIQRNQRAGRIAGAVADFSEAARTAIHGTIDPRSPINPVGNLARAVGQSFNQAGQLSRGLAVDVMEGNVLPVPGRILPDPENTMAVIRGEPIDESGLTTVQKGVADAAQMIPPIVGGIASGNPMAGFAGVMGAQTFAETEDPVATLQSALTGALIPPVAQAGRQAAAGALAKLMDKGLIRGSNQTVLKGIEALGAQGTVQAFIEGLNIPVYASMEPDERSEFIVRNLVANTAFLGMDLPGVLRPGPAQSTRQTGKAYKVADAVDRMVNDPETLDALREVADQYVLEQMEAVNAQVKAVRADAGDQPPEAKPPAAARPAAAPPPLDNPSQTNWHYFDSEGRYLGPNRVPGPLENVPGRTDPAELSLTQADAPVAARETITSSNEGKASEMLAESGAVPDPASRGPAQLPQGEKKVPKRSRRVDDRPWDILDEIEASIGKIRGKKSSRPGSEAYYGEGYKNASRRGAARKLFSNKGNASAPDEVVDALRTSGFLGQDATVDDLWDAMDGAVRARSARGAQKRKETAVLKEEEKQLKDFTKFALQNKRPKAAQRRTAEPIVINDLFVGDELEIDNTKFKVVDQIFNEDTAELEYLVLEDGRRFGVQTVNADQVIYADQGTVEKTDVDASFAPEDPDSIPRLRSGEKQGDLLANQTEELRLVGEETTDQARIQAEREAAEQARRQADQEQESQQGKLFARSSQAYPGGPLEPPGAAMDPADNPSHTVLPLEMPELVRFIRSLGHGRYPKVVERIRALRGRALGVFKARPGKEEIELRADIFDLLTVSEKQKLFDEARAYAEKVAENEKEIAGIAKERYEHLLRQAYDEAKTRNPLVASKVVAHELAHWIDYVPDNLIQGRGNILGHIAGLKNWLKHTLPEKPSAPGELTAKERAQLSRDAERQLRKELGPIREIVETIMIEEPIFREIGVQPADIKKLFGMDARETMPELYLWFASLDAKAKKEIVLKAMKGLVDERAARFTGKEQIGTRQVKKTIRKKSGREPTKEEIRERFRELLREEIKRRRLIELDKIKAEIRPMIAWWRGTQKMESYFEPPAEMYAEAFGIFLNNPAAMEKRAPTYFKALMNYMEARPEVQKTYNRFQNLIKSGQIMRDRVMELRESWARDDERSLEKNLDRQRSTWTQWADNVRYHLDRRFGPIYRVAKGSPAEPDAREAIGNFLYRAAEHELFLGRVNRDVGGKLLAHNLDWQDFGEFMFHHHIINNRFNLANPMGWTSKTSLDRLREMKSQMGNDAWASIKDAHGRFRAIYEEQVVELLRDTGFTTPELQAAIDERVFYATFQKVKDKASAGIEEMLDQSFGQGVGAQIYRQVGQLGEIKNPATATVLKALSLMSAAYRNNAKRHAVRAIIQNEPLNIKEADKRWAGKRLEYRTIDNDKVGTITFLEKGKVKAYYVPKLYAEAFNNNNPIQNNILNGMLSMSRFLKGMYTQNNFGFWPVAFARDVVGFLAQMPRQGALSHIPGVTAARLLNHYRKAIPAAMASLKHKKQNPIAEEALRRKILISREDPRGDRHVEDEYELKLVNYGMDPKLWQKEADKVRRGLKLWNAYTHIGQGFERVNKIAGMLYMDSQFPKMPEWKKQEIIREHAGSPDFLQRPADPRANLIFLFYNPWKESLRSLGKAAAARPFSFASTLAGLVAAPSIMQIFAARTGLGDDDLKEQYKSVSDYDLTNYLVVPLGWADKQQSKVAYLRLPLWEPARLMHGFLWKSFTDRGQGVLSHAGGQIPGINPLLSLAGAWWQFKINGKNPYDSFYGRELIDPTTFEAGGWEARKEMFRHTWNELGGSLIQRSHLPNMNNPPDTQMEEFIKLPFISNALGRWIKVSNRGLMDEDRRMHGPIRQRRAQTRLGVRQIIDTLNNQEALTEAEKHLLWDPYALDYLLRTWPQTQMNRASPLLRRLNSARSQEEKMEILKREVGAQRQ